MSATNLEPTEVHSLGIPSLQKSRLLWHQCHRVFHLYYNCSYFFAKIIACNRLVDKHLHQQQAKIIFSILLPENFFQNERFAEQLVPLIFTYEIYCILKETSLIEKNYKR